MLRKFLMATAAVMAVTGAASAADLPRRSPPPVFIPVPIFTWTGLYAGLDVGYAFGSDRVGFVAPGFGSAFLSASPNGFLGGGHVGYNYQISQFVLGVEGDVDGDEFRNSAAVFTSGGAVFTSSIRAQESARGRIGYAWDHWLFFATGGVAFAQINDSTFLTAAAAGVNSSTRTGYTAGAGAEYAISNNWSVRGEYRYSDFGRTTDSVFSIATVTHHIDQHSFRVGFSYKFDMYAPPAPVIAKY